MKCDKPAPEHCCEACGGPLVPGRVDVYRRRGGKHVLLRRIPALLCHDCGQRVFEPDAIELMQDRLKRLGQCSQTAALHLL